jgi:hypothetical protein
MPALFFFGGNGMVFRRFIGSARVTVDLEHGVVDFDYVRCKGVVIALTHALNPERDMHRGCTRHCYTSAQFSSGSELVAKTLRTVIPPIPKL